MSSLTDMSETGDGTTGWIYTGDAANGVAAGSDYTLAAGVAGGLEVQCNKPGAANPLVGWYTAPTGGIVDDYHMLAYEFSGSWVVWSPGGTDIVTNPRTYEAGDHIRIRFNSTNDVTVEIARAGAPTTWLLLAFATITRSVTLYPKLGSLSTDGAVLSAPKVSV
ncbi:hypothetical protein [Hydrogenophaga sp.]|uniref:hypothetical protein n=1 Tax=Hydrogenophaga sp. TaxID=1904254 RepID=UPI003D0B0A13